MRFLFRRKFRRQYKQLPEHIKEKFKERRDLFQKDPHHPLLRIHALRGDRKPYKSMNITGDYRALFVIEGDEVAFSEIGTHSELY